MALIDLDDEFLSLFYEITNSRVPQNISIESLKSQLKNIVHTFQELNRNSDKQSGKVSDDENSDESTEQTPAILVVDDLGVITYQLKVLLSEFNMDVDCSQEIYDAVNKFKSRKYEYVVMDLFIPTEREGFILLAELKKLAAARNINTIVGIITASPRKEIEQQCKARGADFFLEKANDWQSQLKKTMESYINAGKTDEDW